MAAKKKSKSGAGSVQKALAGIERAQRELQLNIKNLKTAMGHSYKSGGTAAQGHSYGASGKGHTFTATRTKGHTHTSS